jgi:hypothetical protein
MKSRVDDNLETRIRKSLQPIIDEQVRAIATTLYSWIYHILPQATFYNTAVVVSFRDEEGTSFDMSSGFIQRRYFRHLTLIDIIKFLEEYKHIFI